MRVDCRWLTLCLIACWPALAAAATPQTYSIDRPATTPGEMSIKAVRDGSREMVLMSRANGWNARFWYDFAAHREYVLDSGDATHRCSVVNYTSDHAPDLQDPMATAAEMDGQLPPGAKTVGHEKMGGVTTRVIEAPDPEDHGKMKAWIDEQHGLVVKLQVLPKKGPPQTTFDLGQLSLAKPDPALLAPPSGCRQLQGSSNAQGGHADLPVQQQGH